jgi:hypothetical protein
VPDRRQLGALTDTVDRVYERGGRIKVAIIPSQRYLSSSAHGGPPNVLFGRPNAYAKHLGKRLVQHARYIGPLLVVMPSGYGIYDGGRPTKAQRAVLARIPAPGRAPDELLAAATTAVERLQRAGVLRSRDVARPRAAPYPSRGVRGRMTRLYYTVQDDGDRAGVLLRIVGRGQRTLATIRVPVRRLHRRQASFSVPWRVPKTLPAGPLELCIRARDPSGNQSETSCIPLDVR